MAEDDREKTTGGPGRVRERLIAPLEARGLRRKRGAAMGDHEDRLRRMARRFAWMSDRGLDALREAVEGSGDGPRGDVWPSDLVIWKCAVRIETPPPSENRALSTWMRSRAGRAAWDRSPFLASAIAGFIVKRQRPPLTDGEWRIVETQAAERERDVGAAERRRRDGRASADDETILERWAVGRANTAALVFPQDAGDGGGDDEGEDVTEARGMHHAAG